MGTLEDLVRVLAIVGSVLCHQDDFSDGYHYQRAFPQDVMVDVINNFGLALLEAHNERNENNIALSPYGATSVLVALGEGLRGPAVYEIQDAARIPLDTSVIRIGLRDIHRHLKSYFIPKEGFLAGLTLSSENVPLNYDYEAVLRFYGYDVDSFNNPLYPDFDSTTQPNATEETSVVTASVAEGKSTETDTTVAVTAIPIRTTVETTTETNPESESASIETASVAEGKSTETESTTIASINKVNTTPIRTTVETTTESNLESDSAFVETDSVVEGKSTKTESTTIASINDAAATTPIRTSVETTTETNSESESASVKTTSMAEGKSTETESTTIASIKGETTTESNHESESTIMLKTTTEIPTTTSTEAEKTAEITTTPKNGSEAVNGGTTTETITTDVRTTSSKESTTDEEKATTVTTTNIISTSSDSSNQRTTRQDKFSTVPVSTVDSTPADISTASTDFNTEAATTIILKTESIPMDSDAFIDTTTEEAVTLEDSTLDVVIATSITKSVSTSIAEEDTDVPSNDVEETTTETTNPTKTSRKSRSIVDYIIAKYHDSINDWGGAYVPDESPSFFIYGRIKEPNINFMTYDAVLPFAYIPMLNAMALSFPLDSKEYYLLLVLPVDIGGVDRVICDFKRTSLKEIVGSLKYTHVKAIIPSFMLKGYVVLTPTLQKLGIKRIFEPRHSDFSPMTMERDVYVTNIEQAVTVTIRNYVDPDKLPNYRSLQRFRPVEYKADRPFLYFVMDSRVHVCLMAGKIVNPLNSRIR